MKRRLLTVGVRSLELEPLSQTIARLTTSTIASHWRISSRAMAVISSTHQVQQGGGARRAGVLE